MKIPIIPNNRRLLLIYLFLFVACSHELSSYASVKQLDKKGWPQLCELLCEVPIEDSLSLFHIDITGRIKYAYLPDSLSLAVKVTSPSGVSFNDTLSFLITHIHNRPWGEFRFPYCSHVRFGECGTWQFALRQNMGVETLQGVISVGVFIKRETQTVSKHGER